MHAVWKHILPHCANNFEGFPSEVQAVVEEITNTGRWLGFYELHSTNVRDLLEPHLQEMANGNLFNLDQQ